MLNISYFVRKSSTISTVLELCGFVKQRRGLLPRRCFVTTFSIVFLRIDLINKGQVTNYNCALRANSNKYFLPGLASRRGGQKPLLTSLRLIVDKIYW
jgi:hypothetical protein